MDDSKSRDERKRLKKQRREEKAIKSWEKQNQEPPEKQAKVEEAKPEEVKKVVKDRTISIAVAGSILDNAQSLPLRSYLAGQVARAAAIFKVDEVVVFDDTGGKAQDACEQLARILQFMETPQYLRKHLFPLHPDLKYTGVINPLDIPHHLRATEILPYREGVVTSKPHKEETGSFVYVGLEKDVRIDRVLPENTRVTVKLENPDLCLQKKGKLKGTLVSPRQPKLDQNLYWGYTVRIATSLGEVVSKTSFKEKNYDLVIGTSEKGEPVDSFKVKDYKRALIIFGGVEGLEYAFDNDEDCKEETVEQLFHHYLNTCPSQGSRTIRTEEAMLISLAALYPILTGVQG